MDYAGLKATLAPGLRFNQEVYEDVLVEHVQTDSVWVDAGCGRHVLPPWRESAEQRLVWAAKTVVGCDMDESAMRGHRSVARLVVADLERLPFRPGSVSLITANMVVEHLERPRDVFSEFARVLKDGGRVIVHTPNAYSHFVLGARLLPRRLKLRLVQRLDGRAPEDVFPAYYRANSRRTLRKQMAAAGLHEEWCRRVASDAVLATTHPLLTALELLYIRLTLTPALRWLRVTILSSFVKGAPRLSDEKG